MTILSPSPDILITSVTTSSPLLVLINSRHTSPLDDMLATTFLFLCRVGLSLVDDNLGGSVEGVGGLGCGDGGRGAGV